MLQPYVKIFLATAEGGSFSAAAARLYVSKVTVMNQINALEAQIGVALFKRTRHGVALTEAGSVFVAKTKELLRLSEQAIRETRQTGGLDTKNIRIGASMMRPASRLVELWEGIAGKKPDIQFSMVTFHDGKSCLADMVHALGDTIDCFASPCSSTELLKECNFLPYAVCPIEVAMSRKHPLAKKASLRWEDLENESLMLLERGKSYVLDELRDEIQLHHPQIRIIDFDGFFNIPAFNLCESQRYLMNTMDIWENLHPSLTTVPVAWKYEMPYGLLYAKKPNGIVKEFVEAIRGHL